MTHKSGVAFVFPGQGSQYVGMGKDLIERYPEVAAGFAMAKDILGRNLLDLCLEGPEEQLNDTANTQPCIYVLSYCIYKVIESTGYKPQVMAGHSLGEYSALTAAGAITGKDGIRIVAKRAGLMSAEAKRRPGTMLAVLGADMRTVDDVVSGLSREGIVSVANYNCPGQIVVSLEAGLARKAAEALSAAGAKKVVELPVSGAFHSAMMREAEERYNDFLNGFIFLSASVPVVQNTTAKPAVDAVELRSALRSQISSPVKWQQSVDQMIGLGIHTFVEVGPGQVLSKIIKRIDKQAEVLSTDTPDALAKVLDRLA